MKSEVALSGVDDNRDRFVAGRMIEPPEARSLPNVQGRYAVIYADPPWRFVTYSPRGEARSAASHYECMTFVDLCRLPIREHAAADCSLLLWATDPMLKSALALIEAWGFTYKTVAFTWAKLNSKVISPPYSSEDFFMGTGYWTRANPEQCLLATIGKPRRLSKAVRQLIISPRREHSRKPDESYGRIEDLVSGPYLELFARRSRPGWTSWGNQVSLFHEEPMPTRNRRLGSARRSSSICDLFEGV